MNPYWNAHFFSFLVLFVKRLFLLITGQLPVSELAIDEVQIFAFALIGISCALVGTFLVVRKMTMLANSLSHTILIGIVMAFVLARPLFPQGDQTLNLPLLLLASFLTALVTTCLTEGLIRLFKVQEDAAIGLIFTTLFALGVIAVTLLTRNTHIGVEIIMGNAEALTWHDLKLLLWIFGANTTLYFLVGQRLKLISFDEGFSRSLGMSRNGATYLMMMQVAATAIGGFRAVGVVMILALFTAPILIARLVTYRLERLILMGSAIATVTALVSVALARHTLSCYQVALSTSGLFVTLLLVGYFTVHYGVLIQYGTKDVI